MAACLPHLEDSEPVRLASDLGLASLPVRNRSQSCFGAVSSGERWATPARAPGRPGPSGCCGSSRSPDPSPGLRKILAGAAQVAAQKVRVAAVVEEFRRRADQLEGLGVGASASL